MPQKISKLLKTMRFFAGYRVHGGTAAGCVDCSVVDSGAIGAA
jgi:hypothetical protein